MSNWRSTQDLEALGFRDAGGGRWVRAEQPYTGVQRKPAFDVESAIRPESSGVWNRVDVTITNSLSQGSSLMFVFDLQGQQTDSSGSPNRDSLIDGYMDDEEDPETRQMGAAQTFSDLRDYAAQIATSIVVS